MRKEVLIDSNWYFTKERQSGIPTSHNGWERVELPHTWNAYDGQDGGANYFRGECWYIKELDIPCIHKEREYYLEFGGVSSQCTVYVNGKSVTGHKGGYSRFRANITDSLTQGKNTFAVCVDNSPVSDIYPQMADFTFYGGIHRSVKIIEVESTHFDLDYYGSCGVEAYSDIKGCGATLHLKAYVTNEREGDSVRFSLTDAEGKVCAEVFCSASAGEVNIELKNVHLWQSTRSPYLYTISAQIIRHNQVIDCVSITHGFRSFYVDPQKGFFLNGEKIPLRGVSRHGDKHNKGLALSIDDHIKDAMLISEVGANTVRLAHYQHAEEFYELCDRYGFIVWAEIPFISKMNKDPEAHNNCIQQMKELIYQNFNHPCICFWGISNEITIGGTPDRLVDNLRELDTLTHSIDKTRLTTMAQVTMLPMEDVQNRITDILAYNHYFGWYGGKLSDNERWLDEFHEKYPDRAIGISEYGCEGIITYHNKAPRMGDYSEEYQSLYHEHMLSVLAQREWIWGSYVWNMFDFGCDARDEGDISGRNNKGLVSFDRMIKKDAFYICKAYWSSEPFIHICSKRYSERDAEKTVIKVYSNCDNVTLYINGEEHDHIHGKYVFEFENVPLIEGNNTLCAKSGMLSDCTVIRRVSKEPEYYAFVEEEGFVGNWFDDHKEVAVAEITFKDGYYSIRNTIREIMSSPEAGDTAAKAFAGFTGMKIKKSMLMMMADQTVEAMFSGAGDMSGQNVDKERAIKILNLELQKIPVKNKE